ncbi:MAG: sugar kinase [Planctomycetaceae bacterium]|nr:sugar kinase [Planctomycetaceae bacterium]
MSPPRYDVLCAGIIVADHVCAPIAAIPASGGLAMTDRIDLTIGGCASNVAVDLARLELRACVAGRVGDDVLGRHVAAVLESEGVACDQVAYSRTAQTATTMVVNVRGEDRRFIHAAGANAEFTGDEVTADAIRNSRALYVGGFGLNAALSGERVARLFQTARAAGVLTVLDVVCALDHIDRMLEPVLPLTDLFLPNRDEAENITGLTDPVAQAQRFRDQGVGCVVVTCGAQGAVLAEATRIVRSGAYAVRQVDATGGGDAFVAGFLYGRLHGRSADDCLSLGSALGASCVQAAGATTGVFRRSELEAFVAGHPLPITPV